MGLTTKFAQKLTVPFSAVLSADPDNKVIPSEEVGCFYTAYDGVDDKFSTTDAALKINGSQTWCCEFLVSASASSSNVPLLSNRTNNVAGFYLNFDARAGVNSLFATYDVPGNYWGSRTSGGVTRDTWYKLVVTYADQDIKIYLDAVDATVVFNSPAVNIVAPTGNFNIGGDNVGNEFYGSLKNVEIYSGVASNPTAWIPGDTGSLSGVSLVNQVPAADGVNNEGISYTTYGDPQTLPCP